MWRDSWRIAMTDEVFDSSDAIGEFRTLMQDPAARQAFLQIKESKAESGSRMRYEHILRAVGETPWAIRPAMLGVIVDILAFRAEGGRLSAEEVSQRIGAGRNRPQSPSGVAILPLHGVIVPKAGLMSEVSGATSIEGFRGQFRQAMASPDVSSVVIDVDSPGGMVDQVPEMAAEMRAARGQKPIIAVANAEATSAAYWLASQADQFVVTKSGRVGSIGVFTAHEDESQRNEKEGVQTTLVSAGRFKTEGNPFEPLTSEAKAQLQSLVDDYYGMFVSDVAKGRGVSGDAVRNGFGEGRVVSAADSVKLGMSDGIGSLEGTVNALLRTTVAALSAPLHYEMSSMPSLFEASTELQPEFSDQPTGLSAEELLDLETRLSVLSE
jgi:signal peptide peptidase SppA